MAKYVIEIPDNEERDYIAPSEDKLFRVPVYKKNGTFGYFVNTDLRLMPYTEPDMQEIREKVEQEVWEFKDTYLNMTGTEFDDCYSSKAPRSYSEAKAKYDQWKADKKRFHEYDEIISDTPYAKAVIISIDCHGRLYCVRDDGRSFSIGYEQQGYWSKTGRHFPEVSEMLEKMNKES